MSITATSVAEQHGNLVKRFLNAELLLDDSLLDVLDHEIGAQR